MLKMWVENSEDRNIKIENEVSHGLSWARKPHDTSVCVRSIQSGRSSLFFGRAAGVAARRRYGLGV